MTHDIDAGDRARVNPAGQDQTDRILLIACAVAWLIALGSAVAAIVALVGLGQSHASGGDQETPWLLYTVIGVSALVIVGAIPLLIRARRTAMDGGSRPTTGGQRTGGQQNVFGPPLGTENRQRTLSGPAIRRTPAPPATSRVGFPTAAVEQLWLRSTVSLATAIGAATAAVGIATYLMASQHDGFAWGVYVLAGLVTVGMPVIPWYFLRQLRELVEH
jgi:hypothetical protein